MIGLIAFFAIAAGDSWNLSYSVRYLDAKDDIETLNKDELQWKILDSSGGVVTFNEKRIFLGTQIGEDLIPPAKGAVPETRKVSTDKNNNPESTDSDTRRLDRVLWGIPFGKAPDNWDKLYLDSTGKLTLAKVDYTVTSRTDKETDVQVSYYEQGTEVSLEGVLTVASATGFVEKIHLLGHSVKIPSSDYRADLTIDGSMKKSQ